MNIYEKMSKATQEIGVIEKKIKITIGNASYKAVADREVLDAVKDVEEKNGIFSYPVSRTIVSQELPEVETDYNGKITKKWSVFMRIETTYRFVNTEDPKDYLEVVSYGDGIDPGDKAPGKAMTYSDKYALLKAYKIETGDDPDKEASKEKTKTTPHPDSKAALFPEPKPMTDDQFMELLAIQDSVLLAEKMDKAKADGINANPGQLKVLRAKYKELEEMNK